MSCADAESAHRQIFLTEVITRVLLRSVPSFVTPSKTKMADSDLFDGAIGIDLGTTYSYVSLIVVALYTSLLVQLRGRMAKRPCRDYRQRSCVFPPDRAYGPFFLNEWQRAIALHLLMSRSPPKSV